MRIKFKLSPLFLILIAFSIYFGTVIQCIIYLIVVILHEFAHYVTAQNLGYQLNTLHLMPYGASLSGELSSISPKEEVIIAAAGPIFNVICSILLVALWWIYPGMYVYTDTIVWANIVTAVFNCLPVFPLDGGRILKAVLKSKISTKKCETVMRIIAIIIGVLFISCCIWLGFNHKVNISLLMTAVFIIAGTVIKDKNAYYQNLYSMSFRTEKIKKGIVVKEIMVFENETLSSLIKKISSSNYTRFNIVNANLKTVAVFSETELLDLAGKSEQNLTIIEIIAKNNLKTF